MKKDNLAELRANLFPRPDIAAKDDGGGASIHARRTVLGVIYHPLRHDIGLRDYLFRLIEALNHEDGRIVGQT